MRITFEACEPTWLKGPLLVNFSFIFFKYLCPAAVITDTCPGVGNTWPDVMETPVQML